MTNKSPTPKEVCESIEKVFKQIIKPQWDKEDKEIKVVKPR